MRLQHVTSRLVKCTAGPRVTKGVPKFDGYAGTFKNTQEHRRGGKLASVIYMKEKVDINYKLCMERKLFRTTEYTCDR